MTRSLVPVELSFLENAPVRFTFEEEVTGTPDEVWAAIVADPSTWSWFPGLDSGGYEGDGPHGVGSRRAVCMGDDTYRETILAWDTPRRWAYRVDETNGEIFDALAEDWVVVPRREHCAVQWTFAVDDGGRLGTDLGPAREVIGEVFATAMAGLSRHLRG